MEDEQPDKLAFSVLGIRYSTTPQALKARLRRWLRRFPSGPFELFPSRYLIHLSDDQSHISVSAYAVNYTGTPLVVADGRIQTFTIGNIGGISQIPLRDRGVSVGKRSACMISFFKELTDGEARKLRRPEAARPGATVYWSISLKQKGKELPAYQPGHTLSIWGERSVSGHPGGD